MKVAWVCEYPASSFPERPSLRQIPPGHPVPWVVVQAPLVAASGVELHVVTVSKHLERDEEFTSGGVHFHFLKIPALPRAALGYQVDRRRITGCLRRIQPAIVQGFGTESSFGYSAVSAPFPSVLMIQGIVSRIVGARGPAALLRNPRLCVSLMVERVTVRRARHVVCETEFAATFVREHNSGALTYIIRTPIREAFFEIARRSQAGSGSEVLFVGLVAPEKGIDVLISAFSRVVAECPGAVLHVIGGANPGYVERELAPLVARLGLEKGVVFHGQQPVSIVADRLSRAALVVQPTLMDTAPNVLAEARAAGVPVVASAVGGIPELIDDGVDGVLVPPASPKRLAAAIGALLRDPAAAAAMGERGRDRVRRDHRASVQVPKLLDVYRNVLATAPALAQ
jgi:glycosyltransferase involved in cell wall biosynthesis